MPPAFDVLARATNSLEHQYSAIHSIDIAKHPDLKRSKRETLELLEFEFESINAEIGYINKQTAKSLKFKSGGQSLAYPAYIKALEKCTELLIHMERWASWHKSTMDMHRTTGVAQKFSKNDLICKNEIEILKKKLGRKLIGVDYLTWARQLQAAHPNPPVPKAPKNSKKNGTPLKPIAGAPVLTTTEGWKDSTLRKKFKQFTGCVATTKKVSQLKS